MAWRSGIASASGTVDPSSNLAMMKGKCVIRLFKDKLSNYPLKMQKAL
jgi:hypothetical protein